MISHYTNFEPLTNIPYMTWILILIRSISSLVMNFLINFGIAYSNSLTVSIGGFFSIPLNAFYDIIFRNSKPNLYQAIGSIMVTISFLMLLIPNNYLDKYEKCISC